MAHGLNTISPMIHDNILNVCGLTVAFGQRTVVEDLHYTLQRGHTLGVVGESGSGKSISCLSLLGLLPQQATVTGHAFLSNANGAAPTDLLHLGEGDFNQVRGNRIAMVFQEPMTSLNPVHRCGEQVVEMLRQHEAVDAKEAKLRVLEMFREVLLPRPEKIFDSYPHELSGGQKQRVMIAMALICHPDIVIADEPTTALDVTVQKTILDLLKGLQHRYGISIIFISHDLGVVGQIADEVMVMYKGTIVEQGQASQILHSPQHPYTQGLIACRPPLDSRPKRLPTVDEYMGTSAPATAELQDTAGGAPSVPKEPQVLMHVQDLEVSYTLKKSILGKPLQLLKAVDGLTFDIYEGETLGLVGESGCGKSTLGRALLHLIDHSAGNITYQGTSLSQMSSHQLRDLRTQLQIVFQDPYSSLNPRITIGDAILEPLLTHRQVHSAIGKAQLREKAIDLMQQVGLRPDWYSRYPHELSGGQRQRVCIARALILQPRLVVCDESVSALDVSVQAQVLNLLNDLKERYRYTYLFITHDLSVVHYMADRILVMQQGRIVESAPPDQLFSHPQTAYTQTLIDAIPRI